jgi:glycosyltransferase involved in cell wall biosynthesis
VRIVGKKIGFVGSSFTFAEPIIEHYAKTNMVRVWKHTDGADVKELRFLLDWADVVWIEWGDQVFMWTSQMVDEKKHIICRIHRWEAYQDFHNSVKWSSVRRLIFVADHIRDEYVGNLKKIEGVVIPSCHVVPNGLDCEKFILSTDGHNLNRIAMVGYLHARKGPMMAVSVIEKIRKVNPDVRLVVVGTSQDRSCDEYMKSMSDSLDLDIEFREWTEDTASVYRECGFVLSSSMNESFQYSIAEGVLCGCIPLVHHWTGADGIYPKRFLFQTVDQAAEIYKTIYRINDAHLNDLRLMNAEVLRERYDWKVQLPKLDEVMRGALARERRTRSVRNSAVVPEVQEESVVQSACSAA